MRCIDADALMADINGSLNAMTNIGIAVDGDWLWAKLNDAIEHAPTIEPERKKGRWTLQDGYRCSVCNYKLQTTGLPTYCPNCGCEMRQEGGRP